MDEHPLVFLVNKADLMVMNLLSFCLGTSLHLIHFWSSALLEKVCVVGCLFVCLFALAFSIYHFTFSWPARFLLKAHWLLCGDSNVRDEVFSPCFQNSLFVFDSWQFYYIMFLRTPLWVDYILRPMSFMYVDDHISLQIWELYSHNFLK